MADWLLFFFGWLASCLVLQGFDLLHQWHESACRIRAARRRISRPVLQ
jgi:hypothetical protein